MDCGLAREQLDVARPHSADREDPALDAAFAHVDACPACAEVIEFRREFDRRAGEVLRDVAVPAGLRERLLAAVELQPEPVGASPPARPTRRKVLLATTSAAGLLIAACVGWLANHNATSPLALEQVQDFWSRQLEQNPSLENLPAFDGSFDPAIQDLRWADLMARSGAAQLGADIDGDGGHDAVVYRFRSGFLVLVEPGRVTDLPTATSPLAAQRDYAPVVNVAWTEAEQVHLCYVQEGGVRALDEILRRVYRAQA